MLAAIRRKPWLALLFTVLLLLLFFCRWVPHRSLTALEGDSGIFLFIGQQVAGGLTPYVDGWEDKPPVVFWLDAFAISLTPNSARGIVWVAYAFVVAFFIIIWTLLRSRLGTYPALFALLVALNLLPDLMLNPNMVETFSLPFQAVSFLLLCREVEGEPRLFYPLVQGLLAALLVQLRPNNAAVIGVYLLTTLVLYIRAKAPWRVAVNIALFTAAFAAGNLVILWPIVERGYFRQYWEAVFLFGHHYSTVRPAYMHLYAIGVGLLKVCRCGGAVFAGASLAALIVARPSWTSLRDRFALLAAALFAAEVAGSAVSGRAFEHYFLMWVLPLTALVALFVKGCADSIGSRAFAAASICGACLILASASVVDSAREVSETVLKFRDPHDGVIRYVRARTNPADRVFVWNVAPSLLVRLGRLPASRFFHTAAMLDVNAYRDQAGEAFRDVIRTSPKFILETPPGLGSLPGLFPVNQVAADQSAAGNGSDSGELRDAAIRPSSEPWDTAEMAEMKRILRERYALARVDPSGIRVYQRIR